MITSEMQQVLSALRSRACKMTEGALVDDTGLRPAEVSRALHSLQLRCLVRCADSFDPSKRGGHAGVRRWGGCSFIGLWEATSDDAETELDCSTYNVDRPSQL